jgi:hypothetical protein
MGGVQRRLAQNREEARGMRGGGDMHRAALKSGYPWVGGYASSAQHAAALAGLTIGAALALLYARYLRGDDVAPDSIYGLGFAIAGTALLLLVGIGFVLRKRLRHHWSGRLHTALAWHMVGGLLGLALIFMHAAGNFNPRSGTYALYGLMAVVVSGVVGRVLDRVCPRMAAASALATLGTDGEERIELLEQRLSAPAIPAHPPKSTPASSRKSSAAAAPWDLAYHVLDPATRAVPMLLGRSAGDRDRPSPRPGPRTVRRHVRREATALQAALGSEQFFIQLVRVWRRMHAALCVVALGLVIWHLAFAVTLYLNTR